MRKKEKSCRIMALFPYKPQKLELSEKEMKWKRNKKIVFHILSRWVMKRMNGCGRRKSKNKKGMMIVAHNYNKRNLWSKMELKLVGNYMKKIIYASHT